MQTPFSENFEVNLHIVGIPDPAYIRVDGMVESDDVTFKFMGFNAVKVVDNSHGTDITRLLNNDSKYNPDWSDCVGN